MQTVHTAEEWQALLCRLAGVQAAHVVFGADGAPQEVHVLAGAQKSAKAVARDVQSALAAQFGVQIDHHIISVAQLPQPLAAQQVRLTYCGMQLSTQAGRLEASVTLTAGGQCYCGQAAGSTAAFSRQQCIAQATLKAICEFAPLASFELRAVDSVTLGGNPIVVAQVWYPAAGSLLVGSAYCLPDGDTGVAHSVLDAVNRKLALLPRQ